MIYILENIEKFYKIGYSKNPENRVKQLNTGNSTGLKLLYKIETRYDSKIEAYLKNYYKHRHIKGEWFDFSKEDIDNIKHIIKIQESVLDCLYKSGNIFI